jgi:hypothetical protein
MRSDRVPEISRTIECHCPTHCPPASPEDNFFPYPTLRRNPMSRYLSPCAALAFIGGAVSMHAQDSPTPAQVQTMVTQVMSSTAPLATLSSQASTQVMLLGHTVGGKWFPLAAMVGGPSTIRIDYGQPHLRGRTAFGPGGVQAFDQVWRTGANMSTQLSSDVDLTIGSTFIPAGTYSLFTMPSQTGWKLIVNKQTRQWGTEYDSTQNLARIDLTTRTLTEPIESFTMWLIPAGDPKSPPPSPAHGTLKMAWGTTELSVPWKAGR